MSERSRRLDAGYIGNCYASSEALYHILGGKASGWTPMFLQCGKRKSKHGGHWFLKHKDTGLVLDPSVLQYGEPFDPESSMYKMARGCGFLTKEPSKRAKEIIEVLTWRKR